MPVDGGVGPLPLIADLDFDLGFGSSVTTLEWAIWVSIEAASMPGLVGGSLGVGLGRCLTGDDDGAPR
jgi:hypothetical protein